jgi:hypothetical protein
MFKLGIDLSDLSEKAEQTNQGVRNSIEEMAQQLPNVPVKEYIDKLTADFVEMPFNKLDDVWEDALGDIFKDNE